MKNTLPSHHTLVVLLSTFSLMALWTGNGKAQTTFTINNTIADTFVAGGSTANPLGTNLSNLNFGAAGTLAIAPAASVKGEFDSLIKFNTSAAANQFNQLYGAGNWSITKITLGLASNFGTQGAQPSSLAFNTINAGQFGIDWLASTNWAEGNGSGNGTAGYPTNSFVSQQSVPGLLGAGYDSLGTYTFTPPGNNVYETYDLELDSGMVTDVLEGGEVSMYMFAADNNISYLFNSRSYSANHPELIITAGPVPEAGTGALTALGLLYLGRTIRRSRS